jgi:hypothetical protein
MGRFAEGKKPLSEAVARARDDLDRAPTIRTGLHINLENPLEAFRPSHRRLLLGRRAAVFSRRLGGPGDPAGLRDPGPVRTDRFSFNGFFRLRRKPPLTQACASARRSGRAVFVRVGGAGTQHCPCPDCLPLGCLRHAKGQDRKQRAHCQSVNGSLSSRESTRHDGTLSISLQRSLGANQPWPGPTAYA